MSNSMKLLTILSFPPLSQKDLENLKAEAVAAAGVGEGRGACC